MRSLLRLLIGVLAASVGLIVLSLIIMYLLIWSSVPKYDGFRSSDQVTEPLSIERDKWGVPTIQAESRATVSYGIGFVHGQDRFFQMDMQRRAAAGELSALLGRGTLEADKRRRVHGFRSRAQLIVESLAEHEISILKQYTHGVNEGLKSLKARPPEYLLLRATPEPWKLEDSLLIIYAFYIDLQDNPRLGYARWAIRETLPETVVQFLDPANHSWEAAADGSILKPLEIPGPQAFSYLKSTAIDSASVEIPDSAERMPGSNNWVVGPDATVSGFPLLANDPHLSLGVPNTWYKLSYSYKPARSREPLQIDGFSVPGLPGIVVGTNGYLAWGVTNSALDTDDLVILEPGENGFPEYKTPDGMAQIQQRQEIIKIKGAESYTLEVPYSLWGPVVGDTPTGEKLVRRWIAYHEDAANIRALMIEQYRTVKQFLKISHEINLPVQNYVVADKDGHIAWTPGGFLPDRNGASPFEAIRSSKAQNLWTEKLNNGNWPSIKDPKNHRIWTANNRVSGSKDYLRLGNNSFSEYPRAYQIREKLLAQEKHNPSSMAAIQHDNEVTFLIRWRNLILDTLKASNDPEPEFARINEEIESWNGRADVDSIGYTLIRDFRRRITGEILRYLTQPAYELDPEGFDPFRLMTEEAIYQLASSKPEHVLNPKYSTWQQQLESVVKEIADSIRARGWESFRWGERNQSDYRHPITYGVPMLNGLLSMTQTELKGDHYCPKVLNKSLASGIRMIVSPGKPEDGLFQMGCGQSGHPFSPHYRDLHALWLTEEYLPLVPGPAVNILKISPR